ncbi:hypothetical protein QN277_024047 [Acacia crassicarpa]|uniref:Uncharacterized protein n=1 Tax=Acacia crassicarpa TaxID=499986 RepID=A0AAE1JDX3_9FABA|nr:hypothetical protein QN277_024047 [Acacia crassicarpa]
MIEFRSRQGTRPSDLGHFPLKPQTFWKWTLPQSHLEKVAHSLSGFCTKGSQNERRTKFDADRMKDVSAPTKLPHTVLFFKRCQTDDAFSLISALYSFCGSVLKRLGMRL